MGNTPATGWHWKITPEQIEKVKENDRETVNEVYADNLKKIRAIGYGFCRRARCFSCYEDFLQQVYIDLPKCDYTNVKKFYYSLKRCFRSARMFHRCEVSLDEELSDEGDFSLANTVADGFNMDEYVSRAETIRELAPEIYNLLIEILFRGNPKRCFDESKQKKLRDIVEYIFVGYTFEQIQKYARGERC